MLTGLPLALGPLENHRLALDVPALTRRWSEEAITNGTLGATPQYELYRTHRFGVWREPSQTCAPPSIIHHQEKSMALMFPRPSAWLHS